MVLGTSVVSPRGEGGMPPKRKAGKVEVEAEVDEEVCSAMRVGVGVCSGVGVCWRACVCICMMMRASVASAAVERCVWLRDAITP